MEMQIQKINPMFHVVLWRPFRELLRTFNKSSAKLILKELLRTFKNLLELVRTC